MNFDPLHVDRAWDSADVRSEDPAHFVNCDHPAGALKHLHGGMSGKRITAFPSRLHADACMVEYA